jgi:hypothetical protein
MFLSLMNNETPLDTSGTLSLGGFVYSLPPETQIQTEQLSHQLKKHADQLPARFLLHFLIELESSISNSFKK